MTCRNRTRTDEAGFFLTHSVEMLCRKDEGHAAFAARPLCAKISDLTADTSCAGRVMKMFKVDGVDAVSPS
jgi:hypothetical protein